MIMCVGVCLVRLSGTDYVPNNVSQKTMISSLSGCSKLTPQGGRGILDQVIDQKAVVGSGSWV